MDRLPVVHRLGSARLPPSPAPGRQHVSFQEARVQPAEFFWTRGAVELAGPQEGALLQQFSVKS